ncbi:MAG: IclR family transcriptional regulator [Acidobacteria bacterium]|nr:MAG: IclR family transcriptional regulator [Acidobacteriota bacterium]
MSSRRVVISAERSEGGISQVPCEAAGEDRRVTGTVDFIKTQSVPSLDRALSILELLADSKAGLTLPELALRSRLPKSSVHCLLVTLQRRGYLHRHDKTRRYMFGPKLFSLADRALSGMELREQAAPFLRALTEKTGLTTHLAIWEHEEAVLVAKFEPPGTFRAASWIGKRMDVHCTGLGKALIAHLPEEEIEEIFRDHGLSRHNDNTLCSRRKLKEDLGRTLQRGYAIDDEEDELGWRCLGAPVVARGGEVIAAISVAGSTDQITPENLSALAGQVVDTAATIARSLGRVRVGS